MFPLFFLYFFAHVVEREEIQKKLKKFVHVVEIELYVVVPESFSWWSTLRQCQRSPASAAQTTTKGPSRSLAHPWAQERGPFLKTRISRFVLGVVDPARTPLREKRALLPEQNVRHRPPCGLRHPERIVGLTQQYPRHDQNVRAGV